MDSAWHAKKGLYVRGYAERIGNSSSFRFVCPKGHTHTKDLNARIPEYRKVGEAGIAMMSRWWAKERGGVSFYCKKCSQSN